MRKVKTKELKVGDVIRQIRPLHPIVMRIEDIIPRENGYVLASELLKDGIWEGDFKLSIGSDTLQYEYDILDKDELDLILLAQ